MKRHSRLYKVVAPVAAACLAFSPVVGSIARADSFEQGSKSETFTFEESAPGIDQGLNATAEKSAIKVRSAPVSSSGAFLYDIAIDVPPGRRGMTPELTLSYSSDGASRSSPVGAGWSLALPRISRSTREGFPPLKAGSSGGVVFPPGVSPVEYENDAALFEGPAGDLARIQPGSGSPFQTSWLFAAKRASSPVRYEFVPIDDRWVEHLPSGRKRYYGADGTLHDAARITNELGTHSWLLVSEEDPLGNSIEYFYHNAAEARRSDRHSPQRAPILSEIRWGGNRSSIAYADHVFTLQVDILPTTSAGAPLDRSLDMLNGHVLLEDHVTDIRIGTVGSVSTQPYWTYSLTYNVSPITSRLLLETIERTAPGEQARVTSFGYQTVLPAFGPEKDLYADLSFPPGADVYTQSEFRCGAGEALCQFERASEYHLKNPPGLRGGTDFVDFDGDGDTDIIYHPAGLGTTGSQLQIDASFERTGSVTFQSMLDLAPFGSRVHGLQYGTRFAELSDVDGDLDVDGIRFPITIRHVDPANPDSFWGPLGGENYQDMCRDAGFWNRCGDIDPLPPDFELYRTRIADAIDYNFATPAGCVGSGCGCEVPGGCGGDDTGGGDPPFPTCLSLVQSCLNSGRFACSNPEECKEMYGTDWSDPLAWLAELSGWAGPSGAAGVGGFVGPVDGAAGMTVSVDLNTAQSPRDGFEQVLDGWPAGVTKHEVIKTHSSTERSLRVSSDFYAPIIDLNGDGRKEIVLLKHLNQPDGWLRSFKFSPRVYTWDREAFEQPQPEPWGLECTGTCDCALPVRDNGGGNCGIDCGPLLRDCPSTNAVSDFTESLFGIVSPSKVFAGQCVRGDRYNPRIDFTSFFMDVNSDGLPDVVIAKAPLSDAGGTTCLPGHEVFLNRGYRWDTPEDDGPTATASGGYGSHWAGPAGPFGLLRNHSAGCGDFPSEQSLPRNMMSVADVNADGRQDVVFSYFVYGGLTTPTATHRVFLNTGLGFVERGTSSGGVPVFPTGFGFSAYPRGAGGGPSFTGSGSVQTDVARLVDLDDDGLLDVLLAGTELWSDFNYGYHGDWRPQGDAPEVYFNTGERPDLLTSVTQWSGAWTEVDYVAAASSDAAGVIVTPGTLPSGIVVVSSIERAAGPKTGTVFNFPVETIGLRYDNFVRDTSGSEAIGFEMVESTFRNPTATGDQIVIVERTFDVERCPAELGGGCAVPFPLKGTERSVVATSAGVSFATEQRFLLQDLGGAVRVRPAKTITTECSTQAVVPDTEGGCRSWQQVSSNFDTFGYPRQSAEGNSTFDGTTVDVDAASIIGDEQMTVTDRQYDHYPLSWILGLEGHTTVSGYRYGILGAEWEAILSATDRTFLPSGLLETETREGIDSCGITGDSTTSYLYTPEGLVEQVYYPAGRIDTMTYDTVWLYPQYRSTDVTQYSEGTPIAVTVLTERTELDYRHGEVAEYEDANGSVFTTSYDSHGRVLVETGPDGVLTATIYVDQIVPYSTKTTFLSATQVWTRRTHVDGEGRILTEIDEESFAFGPPPSPRPPIGRRTTHSLYDAFGRKVVSYLPRFANGLNNLDILAGELATVNTYDGFDRLIESVAPGGVTRSFVYGAWLEEEVNPQNHRSERTRVRRELDGRGNLLAVEHFRASPSSESLGRYDYIRDGLGQINRIVDPDGGIRILERDLGGRLYQTTLPSTLPPASQAAFAMCYDGEDRLIQLDTPAGRQAVVERDELGRPWRTTSTHGDGDSTVATLDYDGLPGDPGFRRGRLWRIVDGSGRWTLSYDAHGRQSLTDYQPSDIVTGGDGLLADGYLWELLYGRQGQLSTLTVDAADLSTPTPSHTELARIRYEYDNLGQVEEIYSEGAGASSELLAAKVVFDAQRRLRQVLHGNGTWTSWQYNDDRQFLTGIDSTDNTGASFVGLSYSSIDDLGNAGSETRTQPGLVVTKSHTFDDLSRLNSTSLVLGAGAAVSLDYGYSPGGNVLFAGPNGTETYDYTEPGNIQAATALHIGTGLRHLVHDGDGLMVYTDDTRTQTQLTYDARGCLRLVGEYEASTLVRRTQSVCGPDGSRVARLTTEYIGNPGDKPVIEPKRVIHLGAIGELRPDEGNLLLRVPISGNTVVEEARSLADGQRVSQDSGYVHLDMRGSVLARSTFFAPSSGSAVELINEAEYGPWGDTIDLGLLDLPTHQFTGVEPDPGTGFYYFGERVYDPTLRRWLSPDPLVFGLPEFDEEDGRQLNLYQYAANNPVANTDKDGEFVFLAAAGLLGLSGGEIAIGLAAVGAIGLGLVGIAASVSQPPATAGPETPGGGAVPEDDGGAQAEAAPEAEAGGAGAMEGGGDEGGGKKGGGKTERKLSRDKLKNQSDRIANIQDKLKKAQSRKDKTKADKKEIDKLKKNLKQLRDKKKKSEPHSIKPPQKKK